MSDLLDLPLLSVRVVAGVDQYLSSVRCARAGDVETETGIIRRLELRVAGRGRVGHDLPSLTSRTVAGPELRDAARGRAGCLEAVRAEGDGQVVVARRHNAGGRQVPLLSGGTVRGPDLNLVAVGGGGRIVVQAAAGGALRGQGAKAGDRPGGRASRRRTGRGASRAASRAAAGAERDGVVVTCAGGAGMQTDVVIIRISVGAGG